MLKREFTFDKNKKGEWYLDLLEWNGDPEELQMVEGADQWLDLVSKSGTKAKLLMSDQNFADAEVLTLLRVREENLGGGGIYYLETYQNEKVELKIWLCEITRFVFKNLPQKIYFSVL